MTLYGVFNWWYDEYTNELMMCICDTEELAKEYCKIFAERCLKYKAEDEEFFERPVHNYSIKYRKFLFDYLLIPKDDKKNDRLKYQYGYGVFGEDDYPEEAYIFKPIEVKTRLEEV